jgi:hypothetical protein
MGSTGLRAGCRAQRGTCDEQHPRACWLVPSDRSLGRPAAATRHGGRGYPDVLPRQGGKCDEQRITRVLARRALAPSGGLRPPPGLEAGATHLRLRVNPLLPYLSRSEVTHGGCTRRDR